MNLSMLTSRSACTA